MHSKDFLYIYVTIIRDLVGFAVPSSTGKSTARITDVLYIATDNYIHISGTST